MKTEEEARETICHRTLDCDPPERCIASNCMAWDWGEVHEERKIYQDRTGKFPAGYQRVSPQGCAILMGEMWNYEYTGIDTTGRFDLLHRSIGKGGDCGLKRSQP